MELPHASSVDWLAIGTVLQGCGTLVGAVAVIIAAKLGSSTFETWRRQKLTERHMEQAERILTAAYRARRALSYVRNPAVWPYELAKARQQLRHDIDWQNRSEMDQQRLEQAQVYYDRLDSTRGERAALEECQPMARGLFGENLDICIDVLIQTFQTIQYSANSHANRGLFDDISILFDIDSALIEGYKAPNKINKMDKSISDQIGIIEATCVPVLRME